MSARLGLQIGSSLANMGQSIAGSMQKQADKQSEEQTYALMRQMEKDPEGIDPSQWGDKVWFAAEGKLAALKTKEHRNTREGMEQDRQKIAQKVFARRRRAQEVLSLYEAGHKDQAKEAAKKLLYDDPNGMSTFREITADDNGGTVEHTLLPLKVGEPRRTQRQKWTHDDIKQYASAVVKQDYPLVQQEINETVHIRKINETSMTDPSTWKYWTNDKGETLIAQFFIEPGSNTPMWLLRKRNRSTGEDAILTQREAVQQGFMSEDELDALRVGAQKRGATELANAKRRAIGKPDLGAQVQTKQGKMAPAIGGGNYVPVPQGQQEVEKPRIVGTVADERGNVKALGQKDPYSMEITPVDTGVKKRTKRGNAVYEVTDPRTGTKVQMGEKELRANLKEAKALLKNVKDKYGTSLMLPDIEEWDKMNDKKKETILGKVVRLAEDQSQPGQVQDAAVKVLAYLEALGITASPNKQGTNSPSDSGAGWKSYLPPEASLMQ